MSVSLIEISKKSLVSNVGRFRKIISKKVKFLAVVKANAYGHGLEIIASLIADCVDWFGVDNIEEALTLRKTGIKKPILVLGHVPQKDLKLAADNDVALTVYTEEVIDALKKLNKKVRVHLKIETGTNRQGVGLNDALKLAKLIKKNQDKVFLEGISTHFANIEDTLDPSFAKLQLSLFKKTIKLLSGQGINPPLKHTAASAATLLHKNTHFNMVRLGIGLYGLWPSRETQIAANINNGSEIKLLPVLTWKTKIAQVKTIKPGEAVGYGRTWFASRPTKIAILPVGYYDGFDRKFSNNGRILANGKFAPIIGRVAMNMIVADVTDIKNVKLEDEVVLIGKQDRNEITADELAARAGTINYEVISRVNPLIPRVVVQ